MKKLFIVLTIFSLFFASCDKVDQPPFVERNNTSANHSRESLGETDNDGFLVEKPFLKWRWDGVMGSGSSTECAGTGCGSCIGICVGFYFRSGDLTTDMLADGQGYARIKVANDYMTIIPETSCDDGYGYISIDGDYFIGSEFSEKLGFDRVTIEGGVYSIDYSNSSDTYGRITFPVITE